MWIRTILGRLPSKDVVILSAGLSCISILLLLQVLRQVPEKSACPTSNHFYWVITSSRLHLVNRVALESIFLHHPTAKLSHWKTILAGPPLGHQPNLGSRTAGKGENICQEKDAQECFHKKDSNISRKTTERAILMFMLKMSQLNIFNILKTLNCRWWK